MTGQEVYGKSGGSPLATEASDTALDPDRLVADVCRWIEALVIGEGLCPFAAQVWRESLVDIDCLRQGESVACVEALVQAADTLCSASTIWATRLLIVAPGFESFDDFLDLVALSEATLIAAGHEGELQIATFHPDYCFDGEAVDAVSNWTNRSPWPILQLLQEAGVSEAVRRHPDPDGIPARNIAHLETLGLEGIAERLLHSPAR